jgi:uncharacterized zinc-type alcohol dehydrogenase-like protein
MIQAQAVFGSGQSFKPFKYDLPKLGPHDVLIDITHCGLCYSDVHLIDDDWSISRFPLVPGHEIIGRVVDVGTEVNDLEVGARVGVGWQSGSCLSCDLCNIGDETLCQEKKRTCVEGHGGFADKIVVDGRFAYPIPDKLDSAEAAPLLCAGITVYSPFKIFGIQAPMKIGVIGIGGLGHLALQFGKAFGCEVTAITSSPSKSQDALKLGASHTLVISDDLKKHANSFDFVLCTTHADLDWNLMISLVKPRGHFCFVGLPKSELKFKARFLVSGGRSVCGSGTGSRHLMKEMLEFAARHDIKPQIERFSMRDLNLALERLRSGHARYRIVLDN